MYSTTAGNVLGVQTAKWIARALDAELARPILDKDKNTKSMQATCIVLNTKRQCKSSAALKYTLASVNNV